MGILSFLNSGYDSNCSPTSAWHHFFSPPSVSDQLFNPHGKTRLQPFGVFWQPKNFSNLLDASRGRERHERKKKKMKPREGRNAVNSVAPWVVSLGQASDQRGQCVWRSRLTAPVIYQQWWNGNTLPGMESGVFVCQVRKRSFWWVVFSYTHYVGIHAQKLLFSPLMMFKMSTWTCMC